MKQAFLLLFLFLCAVPVFAQQQTIGSVKQHATCAVTGVQGNVVLNCPGLDPQTLRLLNRQFNARLHDKDLQIDKLTSDANDWRDKYLNLTARLVEAGVNDALRAQIEDLLKQGKFEEAGEMLDKVIAGEEHQLDQVARDHYNRATLFELQFKPLDALPHYERAYAYRPDDLEYGFAYATLLENQNQYATAEPVFVKILATYRNQAKENPKANVPKVASTLINLAILYRHDLRFKEAETAYAEALAINRGLVKTTPQVYLPALALTQHDLGQLYADMNRFAEAIDAYNEALRIRRDLAQVKPEVYQPFVADTLINLGSIYTNLKRYEEAAQAYAEALATYRSLAEANPQAYLTRVAAIQGNLGVLYIQTQSIKEAAKAFSESLNSYRNLAQVNPEVYLPDVASAQYNLGHFYDDTQRPDEAAVAYVEALATYRGLAKADPIAYLPDIAKTQVNLGNYYVTKQRFKEAADAYTEALQIQRDLAKANWSAQSPVLALTLRNIGRLTRHVDPSTRDSLCAEVLKTFIDLSISDPESFAPNAAAACALSSQQPKIQPSTASNGKKDHSNEQTVGALFGP